MKSADHTEFCQVNHPWLTGQQEDMNNRADGSLPGHIPVKQKSFYIGRKSPINADFDTPRCSRELTFPQKADDN
jgi:hypothetical protein